MAKSKKARPSRAPVGLTQTMRDYLKSAYRLADSGATLTVTGLADSQGVAPASATAMVKKLAGLELMEHHHYGAISLTAAGTLQALLAIRRHRLVECFLVQVLHFGMDEVHDEAHNLEPVISDKFERKMDEALGHPKRCPHGDPIPDVNGEMNHDPGFPLTELEEGRPATILRVPGSKVDLLRYLMELGIEPQKDLCVLKREPFGGPLHLKLGRRTVLLGPEAARAVYVSTNNN